jgi:MoaA/NifB/PqqE/SkfB family radical SAM enzyme
MRIQPTKIKLDVSTVCQLKCPSCSTAQGQIAKNLGSKILKIGPFKKFLDANPGIRTIELSNWGEIFLNRDLPQIAQYAHEKKVVLTAANGVNLNTVSDGMLEALVKYRFGLITCSIDGASRETYQIYRKGGDFERVLANIKKINEYKAAYRSDLPKLRWQFIVFGHNEHEVPRARQMAHKLGMEFYLKLAWDDFSPVKNRELVNGLSARMVSDRKEYQEKFGKIYLAEKICSQLWLAPQINTDGRVLGCSVNYWGDYGNAFEEDLTAVLNNEKMTYARQMLLGKKVERKDIPCTRCSIYQEMKKSRVWLFSRRKGIECPT